MSTLRELAVAARKAQEQQEEIEEAAYRASRALKARDLVKDRLGVDAVPDPAAGTAFADGIEFCADWYDGIQFLTAKVTPASKFERVTDLQDLGKLILKAQQTAREILGKFPIEPAPSKPDLLAQAAEHIDNGHYDSAIACALLDIAGSLEELAIHGIVTTPITELI